jgi:hypothetical protein
MHWIPELARQYKEDPNIVFRILPWQIDESEFLCVQKVFLKFFEFFLN